MIAIAVDDETVPAAAIRGILGTDATYLEIPNDPRAHEQLSFRCTLEIVCSRNEHEASFYAHAKGSSFRHDLRYVTDNTKGIMFWRNSMYHHCLDHWHEVQAALRTHPITGCFKIDWTNWTDEKTGKPSVNYYPSGLVLGTWMFAGTFFWFRHDLTFAHPKALYIADDKYGVEGWPAGLWPSSSGHSLFQPWPPEQRPNPNIYQAENHQEQIHDD